MRFQHHVQGGLRSGLALGRGAAGAGRASPLSPDAALPRRCLLPTPWRRLPIADSPLRTFPVRCGFPPLRTFAFPLGRGKNAAKLSIADRGLAKFDAHSIAKREGPSRSRCTQADPERIHLELFLTKGLDGHEEIDEGFVTFYVKAVMLEPRDATFKDLAGSLAHDDHAVEVDDIALDHHRAPFEPAGLGGDEFEAGEKHGFIEAFSSNHRFNDAVDGEIGITTDRRREV